MKIAAGLAALSSLFGVPSVAATSGPAFGANARPGGIEVNLGGGSMRQVPCAYGARPGTSCYLPR